MLEQLLKAEQNSTTHYKEIGIKIGKLYTDFGLPIDMAMGHESIHSLAKSQRVCILSAALWWLVEHKWLSNATEESIQRQRNANKEIMRRFMKTGEVGIY